MAAPGRPSGPGAESNLLAAHQRRSQSATKEGEGRSDGGGDTREDAQGSVKRFLQRLHLACRASHPDPGPRATLAEGVCAPSAESERTLRGRRTCGTCRRASVSALPLLSFPQFPAESTKLSWLRLLPAPIIECQLDTSTKFPLLFLGQQGKFVDSAVPSTP